MGLRRESIQCMLAMAFMRLPHLSSLDLNLLLALHALIEHGAVGRAAAAVGLSQPAMSRALGRLRAHLGDPILVRAGRGMRPTPRALALAEPLRGALTALDALVGDRPGFTPATARRTFRLATFDYGAAVVIPPLIARLRAGAPGVTVQVRSAREDVVGALEAGTVDVAVLPRPAAAAGVVWSKLFDERFVCVVAADHPRVARRLTLDQYCALGHVVVAPQGRPGSPIDAWLAARGRQRQVVAQVADFLVAPLVAARSDLIATTPARIARQLADLALATHAPPLPVPGFSVGLAWHERCRADAGHAWFRREVAAAARGR